MKWQLNKILFPVYNLGEGTRIGIWVQGCNLGCKGCLNQGIWRKTGGKSISLLDVFNWVLSVQDDFDGITISGGEPFQQYEQLISFLHLVKTKTKLNVYCFSGYYLNELIELFPDKLFLRYIDTLVDGRYIEEQHENSNLKGSTNQTIYKVINGVPIVENKTEALNKWSIKVRHDNQIYMAGIPKQGELRDLCSELFKKGIIKQFR
jgi:anaerobic ribonucleoside-triphosphate reductase activating protein